MTFEEFVEFKKGLDEACMTGSRVGGYLKELGITYNEYYHCMKRWNLPFFRSKKVRSAYTNGGSTKTSEVPFADLRKGDPTRVELKINGLTIECAPEHLRTVLITMAGGVTR